MSHPHYLTAQKIAIEAGVAVRTVQRAAKQKEFPSHMKRNRYHRLYPDSAQLQSWIEMKRLSSQATRRKVEDKGQTSHTPHLNRLLISLYKLVQGNALEKFTEFQLFALHRDLLPVIALHREIVMTLVQRTGAFSEWSKMAADDLGKLAGGKARQIP